MQWIQWFYHFLIFPCPAYCDGILTCLLSASVGNAVSRVARALVVFIGF
jgi:hypothetical protein